MMTPEQDLIAEVIKGERCCFTPRTQITGSFLLELCVRKITRENESSAGSLAPFQSALMSHHIID